MPQARTLVTRQRLLEATIGTLADVGHAGASTSVIATRARVSQGAVFKHFPSKADLLAAAVEHVLATMVDDFRDFIARDPEPAGDVVHTACAVLWKIFRRPEMRGIFEVYLAARTDAELAARLAPIVERHRAAILEEAHALFPVAPQARADLDAAVDAVVYAMQGAALGLFSPEAECEHLAFLERLAHRELARLPLLPRARSV